MKVPKVEKFFGIFDLRVGALMLGYLGTISNATYALLLLIDLLFDPEHFRFEILNKTRIFSHTEKLDDGNVPSHCELIIEAESFRNLSMTSSVREFGADLG